jgi:NAD+ synthase
VATLAGRIADWIAAAAQEARARGAVVGLSGGADLLPLGGLYKTQVRRLARALGLPPRTTDKPPSAGLWDGQTDERELGITCEQLDRTLEAAESGQTDGIDPQITVRVKEMIAASSHNRARARVCEVREQCICETKRI